jgi:dTDP-4-dehydrorhamnose reductase
MRVLVTGGSGQLARAIQRFWTGHELLLPEEARLDLADRQAIREVITSLKPEVVINAGAFTQVDRCEVEAERAMLVNGAAVGWLAEECIRADACLVQISTDYVFDGQGTTPYREDDPVSPVSVYGKSKLLGEQGARKTPKHLVLRTAWLYDAWGMNFYNTMLRLAAQGQPIKVVDDQRGSPTSCRALARQIQALVESGWYGTVHATCSGKTSWHGFATEIFRQKHLQVDLTPCATADFPRPAPRPVYSVLSGELRRSLGLDRMPGWCEALTEVVNERVGGQGMEGNGG